jgi:hypothetical protein
MLFLVRLWAAWFAYKSAMMMLLIVPIRVQDSRCRGLGSVSCDISVPSGVRLLVVLLVVVWPVVSDMPIYDGFLDVYVFCMLHILYITVKNKSGINFIYKRMAWGVQKGRRRPQVVRPAGGPPQKRQ